MANLQSFSFIIPELVLGGAAALLLLLSSAIKKMSGAQRSGFPFLSLGALAAAFAALILTADCASGGTSLFGGLLAADPFSTFFRGLVLLAAAAGVVLSFNSPSVPEGERGEYQGLLLTFTMGMCLLAGANHLLMLYVALEAVSLCSYLLTGFDRNKGRSREAGLKYVLYGGAASGIMLFGISLLYGVTGTLSLQGLHQGISGAFMEIGAGRWAVLMGAFFVIAGLGFKVAAVPFHMWCPDVYQGAPTPFTALLSTGPKAAGFAIILRFFYNAFSAGGLVPDSAMAQQVPWLLLLGIISAATMTLGNLSAMVQGNIKRLLAYSSIAHAGYLLMGVVAGGPAGFQAVALYLAVYVIMNMGAFAVVAAVDRASGTEDVEGYHGLGRRAPVLAASMAIFLFSLTGLPPTAGFIGKMYLFTALLKRGGDWYMILAIIGILNSVVSLYFYARILRAMYLEKGDQNGPCFNTWEPATVLAVVLAVPTVLLGVFWQPLAEITAWSASMLR